MHQCLIQECAAFGMFICIFIGMGVGTIGNTLTWLTIFEISLQSGNCLVISRHTLSTKSTHILRLIETLNFCCQKKKNSFLSPLRIVGLKKTTDFCISYFASLQFTLYIPMCTMKLKLLHFFFFFMETKKIFSLLLEEIFPSEKLRMQSKVFVVRYRTFTFYFFFLQ